MDLQIMENQEELRAAEDLIRTQQETIEHLEAPVAPEVNARSSVVCDEVQPTSDDLQNQVRCLHKLIVFKCTVLLHDIKDHWMLDSFP